MYLQDKSILSSGRKMQGAKQPRVWRGANVVSLSSRKEQKENTTALKFCSARRLQRATNFTLCGVPLPGDSESQRRVQRENSAFAKRKRKKIIMGICFNWSPEPEDSHTGWPSIYPGVLRKSGECPFGGGLVRYG